MTIPKKIHQIWLGPLAAPLMAMHSWRNLHPDWEYFLWTEENLPALKKQLAFDESNNYPQKSDILRYELLLEHGGIFIDADEYCIKPIDVLFDKLNQQGVEVFAAYEGRKQDQALIANGILGCEPGSAFMQKMVNEIDISTEKATWEMVGPLYLTRMLEKYQPERHIFAPKVFFPIHHRQKSKRKISVLELKRDPEIFGVQLWGSTNCAYKPSFLKNPWQFLRYWSRRLRGKMFIVSDLD